MLTPPIPLTPTLSPSDGEREKPRHAPSPPPREERAGVRRAVLTPADSPHPNPLPVRRGEGEATPRSLSALIQRQYTPALPFGRGEGAASAALGVGYAADSSVG